MSSLSSDLERLKRDLSKIVERAYGLLDHPGLSDAQAAVLERAMDCFEEVPDLLDSILKKTKTEQRTLNELPDDIIRHIGRKIDKTNNMLSLAAASRTTRDALKQNVSKYYESYMDRIVLLYRILRKKGTVFVRGAAPGTLKQAPLKDLVPEHSIGLDFGFDVSEQGKLRTYVIPLRRVYGAVYEKVGTNKGIFHLQMDYEPDEDSYLSKRLVHVEYDSSTIEEDLRNAPIALKDAIDIARKTWTQITNKNYTNPDATPPLVKAQTNKFVQMLIGLAMMLERFDFVVEKTRGTDFIQYFMTDHRTMYPEILSKKGIVLGPRPAISMPTYQNHQRMTAERPRGSIDPDDTHGKGYGVLQ